MFSFETCKSYIRVFRGCLINTLGHLMLFQQLEQRAVSTLQISEKIIAKPSAFRSGRGELLPFIQTEYPRVIESLDRLFLKKDYHVDSSLLRKRRALLNLICKKLSASDDRWRAAPTGSVASGLMSRDSDLDLVLVPIKATLFTHYDANPNYRKKLLSGICGTLMRRKFINKTSQVEFRLYAKVPILKTELITGDFIDIQFGNPSIVRSTNFLRLANNLDYRLFLLRALLLKQLSAAGLLGSVEGLFSSFHVTCLLIHFLQVPFYGDAVYPPLVSTFPQLDPNANWKTIVSDVMADNMYDLPVDFISSTDFTSELYLRLIDYYSQFNFMEDAIDVSNGKILKKISASNQVEIYDANFPDKSICQVASSSILLSNFFTKQRNDFEKGVLV